MYNDYNKVKNYLAHFGISGQKKGLRRFQSYQVAPTRSGMVGQEVGEAAKQRSRLTNIVKGAHKQAVRTTLAKHNPALTMMNANHNLAYRANKYKLGKEQKRLTKEQQYLEDLKKDYYEEGLDTYSGKNPFKRSARKSYETDMAKTQGKINDSKRKIDQYSEAVSDGKFNNKNLKGHLNKLDNRIADTLDRISENRTSDKQRSSLGEKLKDISDKRRAKSDEFDRKWIEQSRKDIAKWESDFKKGIKDPDYDFMTDEQYQKQIDKWKAYTDKYEAKVAAKKTRREESARKKKQQG